MHFKKRASLLYRCGVRESIRNRPIIDKKSFDGPVDALDSEEDVGYEIVSAPPNLVRVARPQEAFLDEARAIAKGRIRISEFHLNLETSCSYMRLQARRSISATAASLGDRNAPYASDE